ncbi:MAG: hypothetical protein JNL57_11010, partial [Bacteroidetes bacterium]|nr:hypothetical protein [Bacteroidota bacterium]
MKPNNYHMNIFYKQINSGKALRALAVGALLAVTGLARAQMTTGTYTINSGASASSSNFTNWLSLTQALQNTTRNDGGPLYGGAGISGPITINVVTDQLTSPGITTFAAIAGTSSTNTITINGGGKILAFSGPYEVISFTGADWVTIDNLIIRQTGTTSCIGIRFSGSSNYNTINKCTIQFSALSSGSTGGSTQSAYIAFANSNTSISTATSATNGIGNTIS